MSAQVPPVDRGRAWLVLTGSFIASGVTVGSALSLGTLFDFIQANYHTSATAVSTLFSLTVSLSFFVGAIAGPCTALFGYRLTIAAGAAISCAGFLLSILATHIWHLYMTLGVCVGCGFGLVFSPSVGVLSVFFQRYFHFAATVSTTGCSVGVMLYSKMLPIAQQTLGWGGAMIFEAASCMLLLFSALIIGGGAPPAAAPPATSTISEAASPINVQHADELNDSRGKILEDELDAGLVPATPTIVAGKTWKSGWKPALFRQTEFYLLMFTGLAILAVDIFVIMTPKYLVDTQGWNPNQSTVSDVIMTYAVVSLCTRILINVVNIYPAVADRLSKLVQTAVGIVCIATAVLVYFLTALPSDAMKMSAAEEGVIELNNVVHAGEYAVNLTTNQQQNMNWLTTSEHNSSVFLTFAVLCGIGEALFCCYQPSLLKDVLGMDCLTASFGYLNFVWGAGTVIMYPLSGFIGDLTGTMRYTYLIAASVCAVSGIALTALSIILSKKMKKNVRRAG